MTHIQDITIRDANIGIFNFRNPMRIDFALTVLVLALAVAGILIQFSASRSAMPGSSFPYYFNHAIRFLIGVCVALVIVCMDYRFLLALAPFFYAVAIALLIAVLFAGTTVKGGERWLSLGGIRIQPSEQTKLALIFMLAWYLNKIGPRVKQLPFFILALVLTAVPMLLILKQPNLGTAAVMGPIVLSMLFVAGCKRWHLLSLFAVAVLAAPIAWTQMKDYQRQRVASFLNPESDPQGSGWHTLQSKITVGSGGFSGKGPLQGTQTYLSYLPEHHTDFIFSLLAEETGFVGSVSILTLFALLLLRGLSFARGAPELSGLVLVAGIVTLMAFHIFVNVAITVGLMPVTGIPLPFLSYGGSFYLTTMMCMGVLLSVDIRRKVFNFA